MDPILDTIRLLFPRPCPYPLIRVGGNGDGAYLVPDDLSGITACFSPGVANFKSFEDELLDRYGIRSHLCDYSSDEEKLATPLRIGLQTFRKVWLDITKAENTISLDSWVQQEEPGNTDLMLQMDIEGAEYRNLLSTDNQTLKRFRIIILELHHLQVCDAKFFYETTIAPVLRRLDQHFVCVHAHANNVGGSERIAGIGLEVPRVLEVTLLRRDRFINSNSNNLIKPSLPHAFDLPINSNCHPPLFLASDWNCYGEQTADSKKKILDTYQNFAGMAISDLYSKLSELQAENIHLRRRLDKIQCICNWLENIRSIRNWLQQLIQPRKEPGSTQKNPSN